MLKLHHTQLALLLGSLLSTPTFAAQAQTGEQQAEDIVISASRVASKRVESGSSITVLDEQYLKNNQARTVAEVLQDVPGVSVASSGGIGSITSVFIRGASSNQTLVIIDGVEVNDLSNITGGYNFSTLMADNIERIEILKGSQSALWGSDAMGGVINIITKKGQGEVNGNVNLEMGMRQSHRESANINGSTTDSHYSFSVSNLRTDGISSKKELTGGKETDSYKNQTISLKAGHQFNDILSVDTLLRYNKAKNEYDNGSDAAQNTGIYGKTRQRLAKISSHLSLLDKQWLNAISFAYSDFDQEDINAAYGNSDSDGKKIKIDLQSDYYLNTISGYTQRISFIAEHEQDKYQSWGMQEKDKLSASGVVLGYGADWQKTVFFNAAVRHDFNSKFEDTTTHHIDISAWVSDGTRLHASQGTGVKNPSFGQLYGYSPSDWGPQYDYIGNHDLKPEKSRSWDAGVEYNFSDVDAYLDLTYFDSRYTDMHSYQSNTYINLDNKATARGIELTGSLKMTDALRVNAGYTYIKTDGGKGDKLVRRPKHSASLNANYQYTPKLSANIGVRYIGNRSDNIYDPVIYAAKNITLDNYTLVNIGAAYQIQEHITINGRLENAFDKDYEEVSGYNTDPLTAYVGVSFH